MSQLGSEITSVGGTSFILDNDDDQTSGSYGDTSSDSDDPTLQVVVCCVFLFKYSYLFVALFITIKVDVNFRTYFIIVPMLRSRFSTQADFETILGIRDTFF